MEILVKGMVSSATTMGHACTCDCNCNCDSYIGSALEVPGRECIRKWGHIPGACPNRYTPK